MATATEERRLITLSLPEGFAQVIASEAKLHGSSMASLMRRIVKWHRGNESMGRHPRSPPVVLPLIPAEKKVSKSFMLDDDDAFYVTEHGRKIGMPRVQVMIVIILQWLGLPVIPQTEDPHERPTKF